MDLELIISKMEPITKCYWFCLLSISQVTAHLAILLPVVQATIFSHLDYLDSPLSHGLPRLILHPRFSE